MGKVLKLLKRGFHGQRALRYLKRDPHGTIFKALNNKKGGKSWRKSTKS